LKVGALRPVACRLPRARARRPVGVFRPDHHDSEPELFHAFGIVDIEIDTERGRAFRRTIATHDAVVPHLIDDPAQRNAQEPKPSLDISVLAPVKRSRIGELAARFEIVQGYTPKT
jgi:hypothetical protein